MNDRNELVYPSPPTVAYQCEEFIVWRCWNSKTKKVEYTLQTK